LIFDKLSTFIEFFRYPMLDMKLFMLEADCFTAKSLYILGLSMT